MLTYTIPPYYGHVMQATVISDDGAWGFTPLWRTEPFWHDSKLVAVRVGPALLADRTAPSSRMNPLPPVETRNWWLVSWSGTDDGSGIDQYEVGYRVGGAGSPWVPWLQTPESQVLFPRGVAGQRYDFRVIAVDRAGNVEHFPADFDATTVAGENEGGLHAVFFPAVRHGMAGD